MKLVFIALLGGIVLTVEGSVCGNKSQCRCSSNGDIICANVAEAPYFAPAQREGKRLTLKMTRDFDFATLGDTAGFDNVFLIGPSDQECVAATTDFSWVTCESHKKTSPRPTLTTTLERWTSTTSTKGQTSTPRQLHSTQLPRTTSMAQNGTAKERSLGKKVKALVSWAAVSGFFSLIGTCCILVSLVNLHERINSYTACRAKPMFAVCCCMLVMGLVLTPIFWCHRHVRRCPVCCCRAIDCCIRGRHLEDEDLEMQQP